MPRYGQDYGYGAGGYYGGAGFREGRGPYGSDYARGRGGAYPTGNFANYGYTGRGNTGRDYLGGEGRHFGGPRNRGAEAYYSGTQHRGGVLGRSASYGGEYRTGERGPGGRGFGPGNRGAERGGMRREPGYWTGDRLLPSGRGGSGREQGRRAGGSFTYPGHRDEIHAYDIAYRNFERG